MPVYLFTYHAYRSWRPDNPRGFVKTGGGVQPPNPDLARAYDDAAKQPPVRFNRRHQDILMWIAHDACNRRSWRLHFVAAEPTHVHYLVSWPDAQKWQDVSRRFKNLASLTLGRKAGPPGRKWFVRYGSRKRVCDRRHFDYLMNTYLPRHRGCCWR